MKKSILFVMFTCIFFLPGIMLAQDKEDVERPKDIGVSDFDNFKNTSFDIKDESATLKESVTHIDKEIKNYSGIINTIGVQKLKDDVKALYESQDAVKKLNEKIGKLDDQSKALLENAKNVSPKTKSLSATKNTDKSTKGLAIAKDDLKAVTNLLETDIKLINDELKARGEPIE